MSGAPREFAAALLVGGHSTRMGTDKAWLRLPDGELLLTRQLDLLQGLQPGEVWVAARVDQQLPITPTRLPYRRIDDAGNAGPLAAIAGCLQATGYPRLLVLAIDLPRMTAELLRRLLAAPKPGAVYQHAGRFEPLAAVYPKEWAAKATAALAAGNPSLQAQLRLAADDGLFEVLPAAEPAALLNWNRPGDFGK